MYINPKNQLDTNSNADIQKIIGLLKLSGLEYTIKPGEAVIKQGQLCDFFFIVDSGSFRAYRYSNDKEVTIGFTFKGDIDTVHYAFINNTHSTETIEAITASTIIKIHRSTLDALFAQHPSMRNFIQGLLAHYIEVLILRFIEFKTITAEMSYYKLHDRQPDEVSRIPLKYIASYLGISQERLSRIRNKQRLT